MLAELKSKQDDMSASNSVQRVLGLELTVNDRLCLKSQGTCQ